MANALNLDLTTVVYTSGNQTISGTKTFSSTIVGNISGTAAGGAPPTGTAGGDLTGTYPNPTFNIVNTNTGAWGTSSQVGSFTVNGKGLITGASNVSIQIAESQVTNLTSDLSSKLALAGGTMVGNLILNADPTIDLQAATKHYVDISVANLNFYVVTASTLNNNPVTYNNGSSGVGATLTANAGGQYIIDTVNVQAGLKYLFRSQTDDSQNGIYTCTNPGSGSPLGIPAVFTRSTTYDTPEQILPGDTVLVNLGTQAGSQWIQTKTVTAIGSGNPIDFIAQGGSAISLTGDVSGSGFSPVTTTLSTVNSNVGSFGSATQVSTFTVNAKGLITAAGNVTISGVAPGGSAGGDLTGTYPNPTIALLSVTNAKIANTTIDLTAKVTGILPSANGGTGSGFTAFSGPTTSTKTFTLPNVSANILTDNAAVTAAQGGTGIASYTLGDTLYASAGTTLSKLAGNTTVVKQYLSQTGNGTISAAPAWATIAGADITGAALTEVNDTNVTLTLGGTPATALLKAASLTLGWTGQLSLNRGGTNNTGSAFASDQVVFINSAGTQMTSDPSFQWSGGVLNTVEIGLSDGAGDKIFLMALPTQTKITVGGGGNDLQLYAGNTGTNSSGTFSWWTVNSSGAFAEIMNVNNAGTINLWNSQGSNFYTDAGVTLKGSIGPGKGNDLTLQSVTGGNWLRLGAASGGKVSFWIDGNVTVNDTPNMSLSSSGLNITTLSASTLVATDSSNNLTSTVSGLSPAFTGLNLSGLTATGVVVTDGSKNLATVTAVSTYTPTLNDGVTNFTMTTQTGQYYKIGHLYFVSIRIAWSGKGSTTAGNQVLVSLPAAIGASMSRAPVSIGYSAGVGFTGSCLLCNGNAGNSVVNFSGVSNTGVITTVTVSQFSTSGEVQLFLTFWDN